MNVHIDSFTEVFLGDGAFVPTVADAVVGPSRIAGRGLFSSRARKAGELLAELDGQLASGNASRRSSRRWSGTR
jgi:hypothetical protein